MQEIPLTRGKVALVDDDDFARLSNFKWYAVKSGNTFYAARGKTFAMHRQILNAPRGKQIDHKDGDGLNNQKENLRFASFSQNRANARKSKRRTTSRFKGVFTREGKWYAHITLAGVTKLLGRFANELEAARAYDAAAKKHFKGFARPNFNT